MVAAIDAAVGLHHGSMAARGRHRADTRRLPYPIGQGGIEELHENLYHIATHPLIVDGAEEAAPLLGSDALITLIFPLSSLLSPLSSFLSPLFSLPFPPPA